MAKIFYVVEKADDYISAHFFKTEKEALTYGIAEFPDFDMFDEPMEDDENGVWLHGDSIDFKKGILFSFEEGESHVQSMDEDEAREYSDDLGGDGATIFFDKFTKGMYGYLGNGADGKGRKWDWDGMRFNESVVNEKFNFSKKEVEKAATLIASAISQADMVKAKVHHLEYDKGRGAGFDISIDGEESAGGSYVVKDNGDVVNAAIGNSHPNAVYNTIGNKNIADVFINMEKYESNEAKEVTTSRKKVLMFEEFVLEGDCKCGGNCTCTTTTTNEANADGTISDDEDDDMENFFADIEFQVDELCTYIKRETEKIGGPFRSPGYEAQGIKLVKATFKKHKIKI